METIGRVTGRFLAGVRRLAITPKVAGLSVAAAAGLALCLELLARLAVVVFYIVASAALVYLVAWLVSRTSKAEQEG